MLFITKAFYKSEKKYRTVFILLTNLQKANRPGKKRFNANFFKKLCNIFFCICTIEQRMFFIHFKMKIPCNQMGQFGPVRLHNIISYLDHTT